ncbi:outer membrane protein assembly factor BamD [Aquimarina sp. 2201CG5-10]|uniref:outer membrane protein assembly factor BamD n=1 Tax=Aquimarina callyspongiae TaxID=3098150 RepID=UPI002AB3301C|nr:outer membrane protein assembly factor BamD [Aquimarina sp. 2201CG5-10]MDY8138268.1 outer membrane protein assembly factor BamD [Aquimarina sp. 2201CG5-10]
MKRLLYVLVCLIALTLGSCSEYQKVLKNEEIGPKYTMAEAMYKEGKYKKALRLFEQIVPQFRGKPQAERIMYYYADTYYQLGDFYLAGYQFERFAKSYPNSEKQQEAAYKSAKSYYQLSPRYSLDQTETSEAIEKLQAYINNYPESDKLEEANKLVAELRLKREKKAFEIAKQYHHRENYKVAISAFDNYLVDYPGSPFREKVLYYKLESEYLLAVGSYESLVKDRLEIAETYYNNYKKYYKTGEYTEKAEEIFQDIRSRLEKLK